MKILIVLLIFIMFSFNVLADGSDLLRKGDQGNEIYRIQRLLSFEGYITDGGGLFKEKTHQAVMAFQRVSRIQVDGIIGPETRESLKKIGDNRPKPRHESSGTHIEVCLSRQLLFLVVDGEIELIALISSGVEEERDGKKPTPTPKGEFRIYKKLPGWWEVVWREDWMYSSLYFYGSYAIHGGYAVTGYPISMGCVRVNNRVADIIMERCPIGTKVFIY